MGQDKPKLAVWKFASCDGCQLTLLDLEDELIDIAQVVDIANFPEASRDVRPGPYDISLVEGSITTEHDANRIQEIRAQSSIVISIGACATAGGIQGLRNFAAVKDFVSIVYAKPEYIKTLETSKPPADYIKIDYELRGCPINKYQLLSALVSLLRGQTPIISTDPVCIDCKRNGNPCVIVAQGIPCMGPVTMTGCGTLCPSYSRGCYGCFGPVPKPQIGEMTRLMKTCLHMDGADMIPLYRNFNAWAPFFRSESLKIEGKKE
jgi:coenzyme F420-reducing hydrogenase gamma subunit